MKKKFSCRPMRKRKKIKRHSRFFVYIVRCKNNTYYTGYTSDLQQRVEEHNSGRGAKYVRGKGPVTLMYVKEYRYYKNALAGERKVKKMTRRQKELMIRKYAPVDVSASNLATGAANAKSGEKP
jgi:putative endonuclease